MPLDSPMEDQKSKALTAALAQIEKQFGKGSIMKMGEAQIANDLSVVSTGSLGLDIGLGIGGFLKPGLVWLSLAIIGAFLSLQPLTVLVKAYSGRRSRDGARRSR